MLTYEQRLADFAHGKKLLRLPRQVRGRADASCDACGSSQPRTLYSLKELESQRYFFVGDTCLKGLVRRGAVPRRYGRESGQKAYECEMAMRAQELEEAPTGVEDPAPLATPAGTLELDRKWRLRSGGRCIRGPSGSTVAKLG